MAIFIFLGVLVGVFFGLFVGGHYVDLIIELLGILQAQIIDWGAFGLTALAILGVVLIQFVGVTLFYSLAQIDTVVLPLPGAQPTGPVVSTSGWLEPTMRGALAGTNAAVNFFLLWNVSGLQPVAIFVGAVNLVAVFPMLSAAAWFQVLLAWSSLLSPMSWLVTGVGAIFLLINLIVAPLPIPFPAGSTFNNSIVGWDFEWTRATFILHGGMLTPVVSAYNMGNIIFVGPDSTPLLEPRPGGPQSAIDFHPLYVSDVLHETGHTLNVALFGWLFHYFGALHQNVLGGSRNGYAELCAESNRRHNSFIWVTLWGTGRNTLPALPASPLTLPVVTLSAAVPITASLGTVTDPEGRSLQFFWTFTPAMGSALAVPLANPVSPTQTFIPDVTGTYTLDVFVGDSVEVANPVTITVAVTG